MKLVEMNLNDNVYRTHLYVVICDDPEEWGKWLDNQDIGYTGERVDHSGSAAAFYRIKADESNGCNFNVIFMRQMHFATLCHELSHFIIYTFDEKSVPISEENTEAFAYYMEYWVNTIMDEWVEYKKGITQSKQDTVNSKKTRLKG